MKEKETKKQKKNYARRKKWTCGKKGLYDDGIEVNKGEGKKGRKRCYIIGKHDGKYRAKEEMNIKKDDMGRTNSTDKKKKRGK